MLTQDMIREYLRTENQIVGETEQNVPRFSANGTTVGDLDGEREEEIKISSDDVRVRSDPNKFPHDQS